MKKNRFLSVLFVALAVFLVGLTFGSCSNNEPTLNAPVPTGSFTYQALTPTNAATPQNLELINTSQNGMIAYWVIPNIGNFTGDTIRISIGRAGNYTVKMAAGGPGGLSDTITQIVNIPQDNPFAVTASFKYNILVPTSFTNSQNLELINTSQNSLSASWFISDSTGADMGTYTGDDVKVTIPSAGTYTVKLTAAGNDILSDVVTQKVVIPEDNPYGMDPNGIFGVLDGSGIGLTQRTWIPPRVVNTVIVWDTYDNCLSQIDGGGGAWWAFGSQEIATDGSGRDGYLDDKYTFTNANDYIYDDNNTIYLDNSGSGWTKALPAPWNTTLGTVNTTTAGSYSDALFSVVPALKSWGSGNFTYKIAAPPAGAMKLGTVTVNGTGAHIGLPDKTNVGDMTTAITVSSITYDVLRISTGLTDATTGATYDQIVFGVNESGTVWTFMLRSDRPQ